MKHVNAVRLRVAIGLLVITFFLNFVGCAHVIRTAKCKERGNAYQTRAKNLKRDAHNKLKIGTPKDEVTRFFVENGLPVTFTEGEATGMINVVGCAPFGCGTDDALLGLTVKINQAGSVVSEPSVGAIYTNCL